MRRTVLTGLVLAVVAGLLVDHGGHLGSALPQLAGTGLGAGAVLALVPGGRPGWRALGFAAGFLLAWAGYALRAGVLPDIPLGHALAVAGVVAAVTVVAAAGLGRIPLWTGLLGAVAMAGPYEAQYDLSPTTFVSDSATTATTVLLAAAVGFAVCLAVDVSGRRPATAPAPDVIDLRDRAAGSDGSGPTAPAPVPAARAEAVGDPAPAAGSDPEEG